MRGTVEHNHQARVQARVKAYAPRDVTHLVRSRSEYLRIRFKHDARAVRLLRRLRARLTHQLATFEDGQHRLVRTHALHLEMP